MEALELRKNVIVVINSTLQGNHQQDLVSRLEMEGYLRSVNVDQLEKSIDTPFEPKPWSSNKSAGSTEICKIIGNWINRSD